MSGNITNNEYYFFYHLNTEIFAIYVGAGAVILLLSTLLVKLLLRPRVVVNCWFCNRNSRVSSEETNSWYCLNCEQYNGFSTDGDYNKDIPEQRLGNAQHGFTYACKSKLLSNSNGLCDRCNENQEMKVKHLAAFRAVVPSNYEVELNIYRNQLENAYRLCQKCETVVSETLERKKGLVLGMQLQQSEKRTLGKSKYFRFSRLGVFRVGLTALAAALCILTAITTSIIKNLNLPLLSVIQEQVKSNYWALLAANFLAQLVLTLSTARKLPLVVCGAHLGLVLWEDQWGSVEDYSYALSFLSGLTLVLTLCSRSKPQKSAFVNVKKMDKPLRNSRPLERERPSCVPEVRPPPAKPVVEETKISRPLPAKPIVEETKIVSTSPQDDNSSVDSAFSNHDDNDSVRSDVNSLIQSLSEWNSKVEERPRTPSSRHEFQSRQYKPVLNPPRLFSTSPKSLNESSWVAGGFWQNHLNESAQSTSRPGSPNSAYSQASSPSAFEPLRPATPTHYPMFVPYSPPNGFQQPFGFQPYMYPATSVVNPMWNPAMFQPICSSPLTSSPMTPSSASCSSASTCGSVLRRGLPGEEPSFDSSDLQPHTGFLKALWRNSSVILYTSAFYVAVTAIVVFVYRKW